MTMAKQGYKIGSWLCEKCSHIFMGKLFSKSSINISNKKHKCDNCKKYTKTLRYWGGKLPLDNVVI